MNISQMRKLTALATQADGKGKALEQRLKTMSEFRTLLFTSTQAVLRAAHDAGADDDLLDDIAQEVDEHHTKHARCAAVLKDIAASRDGAAGKAAS